MRSMMRKIASLGRSLGSEVRAMEVEGVGRYGRYGHQVRERSAEHGQRGVIVPFDAGVRHEAVSNEQPALRST
jgi:hypothetical protein